MGTPAGGTPIGDGNTPPDFRTTLQEWIKDHELFAATLEELAGQLALLEPPQRSASTPGSGRGGGISSSTQGGTQGAGGSTGITSSGMGSDGQPDILQRVLARAPSDRLRAYIDGSLDTRRLQRHLPEQIDQNLRLLGILAAEMRRFVQQLEHAADAAAAAVAVGGDGVDGDDCLLLAAVLDSATKETLLIEKAAEGITLTTPPDEVSAVATMVQLEPFMSNVLLEALREGPGASE